MMELFQYRPICCLNWSRNQGRANQALWWMGRPGPGPEIWARSQEGNEDPPLLTLVYFPPLPPVPTRALIICIHIRSTFFRFIAGTKKATQNKVVLLYFINGASLLENCLSFWTVSPSGMMNVVHGVVGRRGAEREKSGIRVCACYLQAFIFAFPPCMRWAWG